MTDISERKFSRKPVPGEAEPGDPDLVVSEPKDAAAGVAGVAHALLPSVGEHSFMRTSRALLKMNQKSGFDCMSCAWPDPEHRKVAEFCENGAKAVTWEATPLTVGSDFWAKYSIAELDDKGEYWMGQQGRLIEPVYKPAGEDHYKPISWGEAYEIVARELNALDDPNQASFYTSGRTSNEAAFLYQLFVRAFGTNNLPDCSNMCHESTGHALGETIGIGKASIVYEDFERSDLIVIMGQNPGTNHPRMLTALEEAKDNGGKIVAINPLPEAGLMRYKNPQRVRGVIGKGTALADQFLQIRLGGDMALLQLLAKRIFEAEEAAPGTVLDREFLDEHTLGLDEFREHIMALDEDAALAETGLSMAEIDELAERYVKAERVVWCWAMGITQHKKAVPTIREIVNVMLLRGNIGKPGAGVAPIRGHSNVQGDRTMGIWEQMPDSFMDAMDAEFGMKFPREHGVDAVKAIRALRAGDIKVWFAMGGNLVSAISDTKAAEEGLRNTKLVVQVSTKLNRSHTVVGEQALILPTLGRSDVDIQESGAQFVTVEDTVGAVHASHGNLKPVSDTMMSEVAIVSRVARATLGDRVDIDWESYEHDYDKIRDHIANVVPGCDGYNEKVRRKSGFLLPNAPRDSREFPTLTGKAMITVNDREPVELPAGRLLLQSMRSHDQFNTTIYSLNDRYRGIKKGRRVVFVNADDLLELGFADGDIVDLHSEWVDGVDRMAPSFRVVAYPTAKGCAAAYFPEANVLVPLDHVAEGSNTPVSKAVVVRMEHVAA